MRLRLGRVIVVWTCLQTAAVSSGYAQAWVPPKGEGSVSILYQNLFIEDHLRANGEREDRGQVSSHGLLFDATYGLTDRLAFSLVVPAVRARYSGRAPHPNPQDNGQAHGGFQDVRFGVRYNLVQGPVIITPFVGTSVPSHSYQTFAHAAFGRRVKELEVGVYVGRLVSARLPNAFAQARYSYSFAERIVGVHHDRSNLDVELGYFITPAVRAFVLGAGQKTHGGIDLPDAGWRALPLAQQPNHDRIARSDMLDLGGGLQVSVSRSFDVFGSYLTTLSGRNGHALQRAVTVGVSWSFGQGLDLPVEPSESTRPMVRCLCQKGK